MPVNVKIYSASEIQFGLVLGSGSFGTVQLGHLNGTKVAIKVLRDSIAEAEANKELETMSELSHQNVLKLIGIIKESKDIRTPHLIFEFMENGSLLDYIKEHGRSLNEKKRISLAYDVASGMDYLHEMQHIHRDLAARNVLIDSKKMAKIADFGLSRFIDVDNSSYYRIEAEKPVPFRWVPRESIPSGSEQLGKFSFKSDVWSYGVTLFEIWSNGSVPYGNIQNRNVINHIINGKNPNDFDSPNYPKEIKDILRRIFDVLPQHRPTFSEIKLYMTNILSDNMQGNSRSIRQIPIQEMMPFFQHLQCGLVNAAFNKQKLTQEKAKPVSSVNNNNPGQTIIPPLPGLINVLKGNSSKREHSEIEQVVPTILRNPKPIAHPPPSKHHIEFIETLKDKRKIKSEIVEKIMKAVDRKHFVNANPYLDRPGSIGCGVNISAPHMHATMLEAVSEKLLAGRKCLDIGSGSGYITVCLALMVGSSGRVFGIDHMEQLVNQSKENINSSHPELLSSGRIKLYVGDGRKGFYDEAPYDIIHIGASIPIIYDSITDQLREGGRIVTPVGPSGGPQELQIIDKINGKLVPKSLMGVIFAPLTTKEAQLS